MSEFTYYFVNTVGIHSADTIPTVPWQTQLLVFRFGVWARVAHAAILDGEGLKALAARYLRALAHWIAASAVRVHEARVCKLQRSQQVVSGAAPTTQRVVRSFGWTEVKELIRYMPSETTVALARSREYAYLIDESCRFGGPKYSKQNAWNIQPCSRKKGINWSEFFNKIHTRQANCCVANFLGNFQSAVSFVRYNSHLVTDRVLEW